MIGGLPFHEVVGHLAPGGSRADYIQDGIEDFAPAHGGASALWRAAFDRGKERFDNRKLGIGEVGRIRSTGTGTGGQGSGSSEQGYPTTSRRTLRDQDDFRHFLRG